MSAKNQSEKGDGPDKGPADKARRNAIKKLGKYSAYTAPALLTLLTPKQGKAGPMSMLPG